MLLAIDAGNTNVVFALVEGDEIRQRWRIATDPRRTGDEYAVWLFQLLEIAGLDRSVIDSVVIATVVPRARSEEHTSELQSLMRISYAVFCLKKTNNI